MGRIQLNLMVSNESKRLVMAKVAIDRTQSGALNMLNALSMLKTAVCSTTNAIY